MTPTMHEIRQAVGAQFGVTQDALTGPDRLGAKVWRARFAAYQICREAGRSYPEIEAAMKRDHTTVMHGVKRHAQIVAADPDYAAAFKAAHAETIGLSITFKSTRTAA